MKTNRDNIFISFNWFIVRLLVNYPLQTFNRDNIFREVIIFKEVDAWCFTTKSIFNDKKVRN
jgi:hypothetical protein